MLSLTGLAMWEKTAEHGLHPEDVDAIVNDTDNPELMGLGLVLRAQQLTLEGQNRIAARAFELLTAGPLDTSCSAPVRNVYMAYLAGELRSEEDIKAYILEFNRSPKVISLVPGDVGGVERVLSSLIAATKQAALEQVGISVEAADFTLNRQDRSTLVYEAITLGFRQTNAAKEEASQSVLALEKDTRLWAPLGARLLRMVQGKMADDSRPRLAIAATGEVQDQLLRQRMLFRTFNR